MKSLGSCSACYIQQYRSSLQEHNVSTSDFFFKYLSEHTDTEKHDEEITENEECQMGEEATVEKKRFPVPTLRAFCQQLFTVTDSYMTHYLIIFTKCNRKAQSSPLYPPELLHQPWSVLRTQPPLGSSSSSLPFRSWKAVKSHITVLLPLE